MNYRYTDTEQPVIEETIQQECPECNTLVSATDRFCNHCGGFLKKEAGGLSIFSNSSLRNGFLLYLAYLLICFIYKNNIEWFDDINWQFVLEILFAGIAIFYTYRLWPSMKFVLRFNNFKIWLLLAVIAGAGLMSFGVNRLVDKLNVTFFHNPHTLYEIYKIYQWPIPVMILSMAVFPGIFEELTFRGVIYKYFADVLDERLVIVITAFIFAAIHLSVISLFWLIPFGLIIGFLRYRFNTIWYGIVFHFVFNLTACLLDLHKEGLLW
jgi:uncharacterized protein